LWRSILAFTRTPLLFIVMFSNVDQALVNVIAAGQEVVLSSILDAYVRIAGFKLQTPQALSAFERALDKHQLIK
jgi:hypothetical protein